MKKARIIYNVAGDQFEVQTNLGDDWELDVAYRCVAREGGDGSTDYISYRIINKILTLIARGYKFVEVG